MTGVVLHTAIKPVLLAACTAGGLLLACSAGAQQAMSVEDLEALIQEKKDALTESEEDRDANLEKQKELQAKVDEQAARQEKIEQELRSLCEERDQAQPGSLAACLAEMNLAGS